MEILTESIHNRTTHALVKMDNTAKILIWKYFERITFLDFKKARCVYCKRILGVDPMNETLHLHAHIKSCLNKKIKIAHSSVNNHGRVTTQIFDQQRYRDKLVSMIIVHEYLLLIVDHVRFRNYSFFLQPLSNCPSRNTIRNDVFKVYDNEKYKIMKVFSMLDRITTDMWTASNQKSEFTTITCHFIDNEWNLRSNLLRISYMHCSAYKLNLIVRVRLDVIKEEIDKIRTSIAYWIATTKRVEKFEECVKSLKILIIKKLSLDCPTRWTSTYLMLETAMFNKLSICNLSTQMYQLINTGDLKRRYVLG
uniref:BED-type domain-containing protein n=1 Tax=Kalanchoe fedtschenkoi TaxID=63787 RepID=A0A7N0TUB8_KALFE